MEGLLYYDEEEKLHIAIGKKNGVICPYYILKGNISKQAAAYVSMAKDLRECIEALECLQNNPQFPKIAQSSLFFASVVKYARCFTSAKRRGTSLSASRVFKEKKKYLDFHKEVMDLRNEYLAHAGEGSYESIVISAILNPNRNKKAIETLNVTGFKLQDDNPNISEYISLYKIVFEHCDNKCMQLIPLARQEANDMDIDEIYAKSKTAKPDKLIPFDVNII